MTPISPSSAPRSADPGRPSAGSYGSSAASDASDVSAARAFKPGPGFYILICLIVLTIVLALSAAITSALGVTGTSRILGGTALILVGLGMLSSLRVSPAPWWSTPPACAWNATGSARPRPAGRPRLRPLRRLQAPRTAGTPRAGRARAPSPRCGARGPTASEHPSPGPIW